MTIRTIALCCKNSMPLKRQGWENCSFQPSTSWPERQWENCRKSSCEIWYQIQISV